MPSDCYELANQTLGLRPGDADFDNPVLAEVAAQYMSDEGWTFVDYNEYGEEVYSPPTQ